MLIAALNCDVHSGRGSCPAQSRCQSERERNSFRTVRCRDSRINLAGQSAVIADVSEDSTLPIDLRMRELGGIVAEKIPGRTAANKTTLFKSNGIATWDLAVAVRVYELAVARGVGQSIPLWESQKTA